MSAQPPPPPPPPVPLAGPGAPGPGRKWYVVAALVFLVGAIGGGILLFMGISGLREGLIRAPVPGSTIVDLDETGRWTVFYEYQGEIDDVLYSLPPQVPDGLEVTAVDSTGDRVPLETGAGSFNYSTGSRAGLSIGYIDVTQPGRHTIEASHPGGTRFNVALGKAIGHKTGQIVFGVIAFLLFGFVAFVIVVTTVILRSRAKSRTRRLGTSY